MDLFDNIEGTIVKCFLLKKILKLLDECNIKYSYEYDFIRVFGNFYGYSIVRANADDQHNPVEIDGKIHSFEEFEDWLHRIKE